MKNLTIVFVGFFSFVFVDLNLLRRTRSLKSTSLLLTNELTDNKKKNKQKKRHYPNKKYNKRRTYKSKTIKLKGTKPRDHRYSNQKKLRRMYRNS